MQYYIFLTIIIFFVIAILIYYRIKYNTSNRNNFYDTKYDIVDYISEIQSNESALLKNKINLANVMLHDTPNSTSASNPPDALSKYGFKSCESAVAYFKNKNLNIFVPTPEMPTPLAEICSSYLQTTDKANIQDLENLNSTVNKIVNQADKSIDSKLKSTNTSDLLNYMEGRYSELANDPVFNSKKSIGYIMQFYQKKMNKQLPDNLQLYTSMIYGRFKILPNQFIQLNDWDMEILADTINFIYSNTRIISYKFTYSDINPGAEYIYIHLGDLLIKDKGILLENDINYFIKFLNELNFKPNVFIHIAKINGNTYAVKSSDFNTMFLIEEIVGSTPTLVLQGTLD